MSNNINDETGVQPVSPLATPAVANIGVSVQEVQKAEALPTTNLNLGAASRAPGGMVNEISKVDADSQPPGGNFAVDREKEEAAASAGSLPPLSRPGVQTVAPFLPTESQVSCQTNRPSAKEETQTAGRYPPRLPPTATVASCPEEPKLGESVPPPLLDIEEFMREVEERKRGAKTMREIKSLGDYIQELLQRGVPLGPIYEGLKRRGLVSCSRSRFGEICAELFPDLFGSTGRRNA